MRISGNERASMIMGQKKEFQRLESDVHKVSKQAEANSIMSEEG